MRILVLGGTWFLGREVVEQALRRGWEVSTFNRGRSAPDVPGVQAIQGDRTSEEDLWSLARRGRWDAAVDTSASELTGWQVMRALQELAGAVDRYVFVSTVSAYAGWPDSPLTEDSPRLDVEGWMRESFAADDPAPIRYGRNKAAAEQAVTDVFAGRSVVLRPGVIVGPGEYVGRLPWWLTRAERGGPILAPSPAERVIQPVDVRDVAAFALDQAAAEGPGAFNLAHPRGISFGGFVAACLEVTGGSGHPVWASPEVLSEHGVRQWTELPLWRTHAGAWAVDSSRAVAAGLRCRPVRETIADTWAWWQADGRPVGHPRWSDHGIDPEKEAKILADLA